MHNLLKEERFDFVSDQDKAFISAFDAAMTRLGYECGGKIGPGYCWGKYMLIYTKSGVKSKTVYARIYIREHGLVLRLFLNDIDKHQVFLENAPAYIKEVFTGTYGDCLHDKDDGTGHCMFRKTYTLDGRLIEKCNGRTFEFNDPKLEKMDDYLGLFLEFFPLKKAKTAQA